MAVDSARQLNARRSPWITFLACVLLLKPVPALLPLPASAPEEKFPAHEDSLPSPSLISLLNQQSPWASCTAEPRHTEGWR